MAAILAPTSVGISELQANLTALLDASGNQPVAILNGDKPVAYMLTAQAWEKIHDILEDIELHQIAEMRLTDGKPSIKVEINDL